MGSFSDGKVADVIDNSIGPALAVAYNDAVKSVFSSTEVRWRFTWEGLNARITLGGSGFSGQDVDGTVTSFTFTLGGATIFSLTGISVPRFAIADAVHVNNGTGLQALLYAGNDTFTLTRAGTDYALYGADGNDTFSFDDNFTADDMVVGGAGTDTLSLSGDYTLALTDTTMREVEVLKLAAGGSYEIAFADANVASGARLTINAAGLVAADTLTVNGSAETNGKFVVNAGAGGDRITGGAQGDTLSGAAGNDTLAGGNGTDILKGGFGADTLNGGNGSDTLSGQAGHDRLVGGASGDRFQFTQSGVANSDTIADFSHAQGDRILLENAAFPALGAAAVALSAAQFRVGAAAQDADDRIVYNAATGKLYYDSDGSAANVPILVATLTGHPTLLAADIVVT